MNFRYYISLATMIFWLLPCVTAVAENLLLAEHGKHSVTFLMPDTVPPFPAGTQVEFFYLREDNPPRKLWVEGMILGINGNVAFIELSEWGAVRLTHAKESGTVKVVKKADPDPDLVAQRRAYAAEAVPMQVAPRMRTLTVRVPSATENVETWERGDILIFRDVLDRERARLVRGKHVKSRDVSAVLMSTATTEDGGYEIEIVADPAEVRAILRADAKGPLTIEMNPASRPKAGLDGKKCYVRRRTPDGSVSIEIPCVDH